MNVQDGLWRGSIPRRALTMIQAWRKAHVEELLSNWALAQSGGPLVGIEPLE